MDKIKAFFKIIVSALAVVIIMALLGLIGSGSSTASGGDSNLMKNSELLYENSELSKVREMYGDLM